MEDKNNQQEKEITLDGLALMMNKGFDKSNKLTDKKIEELATIVQNSLMELKSELKSDIKKLETDIKDVKSDTEDIKAELHKKVDKITYNNLEYRVEKLEKKFA